MFDALQKGLNARTGLVIAGLVLVIFSQPSAAALAVATTENVAAYFHRSPDDVRDLRSQGFGYGEIVKILVVAEMSHESLPALLARNRDGYGWGTISLQLGLNPAQVKKRVDNSRRRLDIHVHPLPPSGKP